MPLQKAVGAISANQGSQTLIPSGRSKGLLHAIGKARSNAKVSGAHWSLPSVSRTQLTTRAAGTSTVRTSAASSADDSDEIAKLLEENNRLRQLVQKNADQLQPEKLEHLAQGYQTIVASAEQAGMKLDVLQMQLTASAVAEALTSTQQFQGSQPSQPAPAQPPAHSAPPPPPPPPPPPSPKYQYTDQAGQVVGVSVKEQGSVTTFSFGGDEQQQQPSGPQPLSAQLSRADVASRLSTEVAVEATYQDIAQAPLGDSGKPEWLGANGNGTDSSTQSRRESVGEAFAGGVPMGRRVVAMAQVVEGGQQDEIASHVMVDSPQSSDAVNSSEYLRDVVNLSVELDDSDSEDKEVEKKEEASARPARQQAAAPAAPVAPAAVKPVAASTTAPAAAKSGAAAAGSAEAAKEVIRTAARALVQNHIPSEAAADKHHWMVVTVPEKPVAGEELVIYFNRKQSEALRDRPAIQMQYGFNQWELVPEENNRISLFPSEIPKNLGSDFWSCKIKVPADSYEVNFVFSDSGSVFENNAGQDFVYPTVAGITWDDWVDAAADRAAKAEAERQAKLQKDREESERQRQADLIQQDKDKGRRKADDLKNGMAKMQENAPSSMERNGQLLWRLIPENPKAGDTVRLQYNMKASPLSWLQMPEGTGPTLRYGFNGWMRPGVVEMKQAKQEIVKADAKKADAAAGAKTAGAAAAAKTGAATADAKTPAKDVADTPAADTKAAAAAAAPPVDEGWWEAGIAIPYEAAITNFVVNYNEHYDNNDRKDYKFKVGLPKNATTVEAWIDQCAEMFRLEEYETRMAKEQAEMAKQKKRDEKRRKAQDIVKAVERRKVRHVLFTEPEVVQAGQEVTVFYNPRDTLLNGHQDIHIIGGWNRWNHARKFGPIKMEPPAYGGEHWQATIKVPGDAYKMDFVFSDVAGGDGTYDNRGGFDYHLPVEGSPVREPSLYVTHIAVEMAPIAKVGGLGDVVTALGRAVKDQGHQCEVILPRYEFLSHSPLVAPNLKYETEFDWGGTRIYVTTCVVEGLRCFFVEPRNSFFAVQTVYGRYDDEVRFDFFCKAAMEFLLRTGRQPDILHCHDWSTAHVAKSYWEDYNPYGLWRPKVVFTIHNMNYGAAKISEAAFHSNKFTTVSPTYAFEVGGSPIIASQSHKFMGIRNGIDPELWDPESNAWLPMPYNSENVVAGKAAARKALRERLNLTSWGDKFIVGVVSRLTKQKGVHLIKHAAHRALERGGQFVLLGSAPDPKVQEEFNEVAQQNGGDCAAFCFKYDEPLSHLIYAACDMIVVPSMFEPCGLTQMIAMRYGTVPIVRHTGGLKDTVFDVDFDKARAAWDMYGSSDWERDQLDATNGFAFEGTDPGALDYAMNRAIDAWYNDRAWFHSLQKRVMEQDWSWNRPALDYIELYFSCQKS